MTKYAFKFQKERKQQPKKAVEFPLFKKFKIQVLNNLIPSKSLQIWPCFEAEGELGGLQGSPST